jgi:hypothetical protein
MRSLRFPAFTFLLWGMVSFTTDAAGQARATGTFEAVAVIPAGTKTLTEGLFDVAVMPI